MIIRHLGLAALLLATAARGDPAQPGLHGIALGMTPNQASAAAHLPCQTPQYSSDLACKDASDGSNYQAMFSAGEPSIALSVQHDFCTPASPETVLEATERTLQVAASAVRRDPNGFTIDLGNDDEAILNADDGTCRSGGKHYVLLIRSNSLLKMSSDKAAQRVKNALH